MPMDFSSLQPNSGLRGSEDAPWGLAWANDPVSGDPYFGWDWHASGIPTSVMNAQGDLNRLWTMIEAMKNNNGAGDNLQDIIALIVSLGQNGTDRADPTVNAFFNSHKGLFAPLIDAELLLVYSQNAMKDGKADPEAAFTAMSNFANSLLGKIGSYPDNDPILGDFISELKADITPDSKANLLATFWAKDTSGNYTFIIPASFNQDAKPVDLSGPDGLATFANYVFSTVLYQGTFGNSTFAHVTDDLFLSMFMGLLENLKHNPDMAFVLLMILFGSTMDNGYNNDIQGLGYINGWLTRHQDDLQKLIAEFQNPSYFTDTTLTQGDKSTQGQDNAVQWMNDVRQLFLDTQFSPYTQSLVGNVESAWKNILGLKDPNDTSSSPKSLSDYLYGSPTDSKDLAAALNILSQGKKNAADPTKSINPNTTVVDNFQAFAKTLTDRGAQTQTQVSAKVNNDNTVVNTMKSALDNVKSVEDAANKHMGGQ